MNYYLAKDYNEFPKDSMLIKDRCWYKLGPYLWSKEDIERWQKHRFYKKPIDQDRIKPKQMKKRKILSTLDVLCIAIVGASVVAWALTPPKTQQQKPTLREATIEEMSVPELKEMLAEAVEVEDYHRAAKIRDLIKLRNGQTEVTADLR